MNSLRSTKTRIFLICWIAFSITFSTNIVREHYPAFALIDHGDFRLDEYEGFHSDIFRHKDGHCYIGNQVAGSLPAVLPLLVFDPILDRLEAHSKKVLAASTEPPTVHYQTDYPNRVAFLKKVKERGLDLRFGASAAITSICCMAPIAALTVVMLFGALRRRGLAEGRASTLAFLFAFATPILYRASHLNHNFFLMTVVFGSFLLLWRQTDPGRPVGPWRRFFAGFLAGWGIALDYAGVVPLLCLYVWFVAGRARECGFWRAFRESLNFVLGSIPPVAFLCWTQWWMYGDPFLPGQKHMPEVNFTERGWRGFDWPAGDLFLENLISPDFGLFTFAPLLALALLPTFLYRRESLLLPRRERAFVWTFVALFLVFCAANQYSRMQWNTGFRYLLPIVPFLFLALADHLARWPAPIVFLLGAGGVADVAVLSMARFTRPDFQSTVHAVPECWRRILHDGIALPWLSTLRQTVAAPDHWIHWQIWPFVVLLAGFVAALYIWTRPSPMIVEAEHTAAPMLSADEPKA